jgi:hypothetical protein
MPLLGFKKQFAPAVESGDKRQTMRARRKDGRDPKPGDTLYLYTALRTKQARKLGEHVCTAVKPITVTPDTICLGGTYLGRDERNAFARADGFDSFDELIEWMALDVGREFPWHGIVVFW